MSYSLRSCLPQNIKYSSCLNLGPNPEKTNETFNKFFIQNYSELAFKEFLSDQELRMNVMKNIIASFNCQIHHEIIKEKIGFAVWMIGEYSLSISDVENGLSSIKQSIGEIHFPNDHHHDWFQECRRRLLLTIDGENIKLRIQIAIALAKLLKKLKVFDVLSKEKLRRERLEAVRFMAAIWLLPKPVGLGPSTIEFYNVEIKRCIKSLCDIELEMILEKENVENLISFVSKKLEEDETRNLCDKALNQFEEIFLGSNNSE